MKQILLQAYKTARGDSAPWYPGAAAQALRHARYALKSEALARALNVPRYLGDKETFALPGGARIVFTCEPDDCNGIADNFGVKVEWLRGHSWGSAATREENAPDWWIDRDGIAYARGDRRDRARVESDYSLAQRVADRRKYMARHAAYTDARRSLADEFATVREYWNGAESFCYCRAELYDASGALVADDACGGISTGDNYPRDWFLESASGLIASWEQHCTRAVIHARASIRARRSRTVKLIRELRSLSACNRDAPEICATLRCHVSNMRALISESARTLRQNKNAILQLWTLRA